MIFSDIMWTSRIMQVWKQQQLREKTKKIYIIHWPLLPGNHRNLEFEMLKCFNNIIVTIFLISLPHSSVIVPFSWVNKITERNLNHSAIWNIINYLSWVVQLFQTLTVQDKPAWILAQVLWLQFQML